MNFREGSVHSITEVCLKGYVRPNQRSSILGRKIERKESGMMSLTVVMNRSREARTVALEVQSMVSVGRTFRVFEW